MRGPRTPCPYSCAVRPRRMSLRRGFSPRAIIVPQSGHHALWVDRNTHRIRSHTRAPSIAVTCAAARTGLWTPDVVEFAVSPLVGQAVLACPRSYSNSGSNSVRAGRRHRLPHLRSSRQGQKLPGEIRRSGARVSKRFRRILQVALILKAAADSWRRAPNRAGRVGGWLTTAAVSLSPLPGGARPMRSSR